MNLEKFSSFLKELRKEKGLTQEEVADQLLVHRTTYVKWENGSSIPLNDSLMLLAEFFDVSVDELLAGEKITNDKYVEVHNKILFSLLSVNRKSVKVILRLSILLVLLITSFLIYYFISTYNSVHVYLLYGENDEVKVRDSLLFLTNDVLYLRFGNIYLKKEDQLLNVDNIELYSGDSLIFKGDPKQLLYNTDIKGLSFKNKDLINKNFYILFNYNQKDYNINLSINNDFKNKKFIEKNKNYFLDSDLSLIDNINLDNRFKYNSKDKFYYYKDKEVDIKCYEQINYCIIITNDFIRYEFYPKTDFIKIINMKDGKTEFINYSDNRNYTNVRWFKEKIYDKYLK